MPSNLTAPADQRAETRTDTPTETRSVPTEEPRARRPPEDRAPWRALDEGLPRVR